VSAITVSPTRVTCFVLFCFFLFFFLVFAISAKAYQYLIWKSQFHNTMVMDSANFDWVRIKLCGSLMTQRTVTQLVTTTGNAKPLVTITVPRALRTSTLDSTLMHTSSWTRLGFTHDACEIICLRNHAFETTQGHRTSTHRTQFCPKNFNSCSIRTRTFKCTVT